MTKRRKRILTGLALFILVAVVAIAALFIVKVGLLKRELARWQAAGYPLEPGALMPPEIPDEENAALAYLDLLRGLTGLPDWSDEGTAWYAQMHLDPSPDGPVLDHRSSAIRVAEHFAEELATLHELLEPEQQWRFPEPTYKGDISSFIDHSMVQQLLMIEVRACAAAGDLEGMARSCETLARLAERLGEVPSTFGWLDQVKLDGRLLRLLEEEAPQGLQLAGLEAQLRQRDYRAASIDGLIGGTAAVLHWRQHMPATTNSGFGGRLVDFWNGDDLAYCLATTREAVERFEPDYCDQVEPTWQPKVDEGDTYSEMLLSGLSGHNAVVANSEARRRMALFAFELRRQKEALGSYETALAQAEVPISPTTGKPFEVAIADGVLTISTDDIFKDGPLEWCWE